MKVFAHIGVRTGGCTHMYVFAHFVVKCRCTHMWVYLTVLQSNVMTCHICSKFIQNNYKDNFKFSEKTSAYIAGAVYDVSMLFSPFMGTIVASLPVY